MSKRTPEGMKWNDIIREIRFLQPTQWPFPQKNLNMMNHKDLCELLQEARKQAREIKIGADKTLADMVTEKVKS